MTIIRNKLCYLDKHFLELHLPLYLLNMKSQLNILFMLLSYELLFNRQFTYLSMSFDIYCLAVSAC